MSHYLNFFLSVGLEEKGSNQCCDLKTKVITVTKKVILFPFYHHMERLFLKKGDDMHQV